MVSWIIIAVLIVLVWLFFRAKRMQHKTYTILIIFFLLFFYVTGSKVLSNHNVNLTTFTGMVTAGKLYFQWLENAFINTKELVGNAIKMNWVNTSVK